MILCSRNIPNQYDDRQVVCRRYIFNKLLGFKLVREYTTYSTGMIPLGRPRHIFATYKTKLTSWELSFKIF